MDSLREIFGENFPDYGILSSLLEGNNGDIPNTLNAYYNRSVNFPSVPIEEEKKAPDV